MTDRTDNLEAHATLLLSGLHCQGCANNVQRALAKVDGVLQARVVFAAEQADVSYDPARVDVPALIAAVEAAGYGARLPEAAPSPAAAEDEAERAARAARRRLVIA